MSKKVIIKLLCLILLALVLLNFKGEYKEKNITGINNSFFVVKRYADDKEEEFPYTAEPGYLTVRVTSPEEGYLNAVPITVKIGVFYDRELIKTFEVSSTIRKEDGKLIDFNYISFEELGVNLEESEVGRVSIKVLSDIPVDYEYEAGRWSNYPWVWGIDPEYKKEYINKEYTVIQEKGENQKVGIDVYRNGEKIRSERGISANKTYTFENLEKYDENGKEYNYTFKVVEDEENKLSEEYSIEDNKVLYTQIKKEKDNNEDKEKQVEDNTKIEKTFENNKEEKEKVPNVLPYAGEKTNILLVIVLIISILFAIKKVKSLKKYRIYNMI